MTHINILQSADIRSIIRPFIRTITIVIILLGLVGGWAGTNWLTVLLISMIMLITIIWISYLSKLSGSKDTYVYISAIVNLVAAVLIVSITGGVHSPFWLLFFVGAITSAISFQGKAGEVFNILNVTATVIALLGPEIINLSLEVSEITLAIMQVLTLFISGRMIRKIMTLLLENGRILSDSEIRSRMLIEESPIGIAILDQNYQFIMVNSMGYQLLGYQADELIGLKASALIDPEDLARKPIPSLEEMQSGLTVRRERIVICKDSRHISVLGSFKQMPDGQLLYTFQDITERKQAEQELRDNEQRYRALFEQSNDAVAIMSLDRKLLAINEHGKNLLGYLEAEMVGRDALEISRPVDEEDARLKFDQVVAGKILPLYERPIIRKDGSTLVTEINLSLIHDTSGKPWLVQSITRDVTERKKAEEKLRQRANQMSALYDIGLTITSNLELNQILKDLFEKCKNLLPIDKFYVALYDESIYTITHPLYFVSGEYLHIPPRDIRENPGLSGHVITSRQTLYVPDMATTEAQEIYGIVFTSGVPSRSYVGTPLFFRNEIIGLVAMQHIHPDAYSPEQIRLLETIATQAAIAIENARLFESGRLALEQSETLRESAAIVTATLNEKDAINQILEQLKRVVPYNSASVQLMRGDRLEIVGGNGLPSSDVGISFVITEQEPSYPILREQKPYVLFKNIQEVSSAFKELLHILSWLAVPLKVKGRILGIIVLDGHESNQFSEHHAQLAVAFADQVAIALENASLYTEVQQELTERKRAEEKITQLNIELENRVKERTAQLNEANQSLHQEKARLEQYTRQREIMGTMTDLLQASLTTDEASRIVSSHLQLLFPNRDGALYLLNTSNNMLEPITVWGNQKSLDTVFNMDDCWALRRGKPYRFGIELPNPTCAHIGNEVIQSAVCIPLTAQGENIGSLHISTKSMKESNLIDDEEQRFIETIADSIALALANVRLRERLRIQSIHDGLTGLFNRRYLDETLPREIHRAERNKQPISVLMFDIDHFKKFNDTYGHDAGDIVLKQIAELILSKIRPSDIACRYGGEEFTIILPDTPIEIARVRAENLREAISQVKVEHHGKDIGKITISVGIAVYPLHGIIRDTLIKSADEAAYQAKERGRNRVVLATTKEKL